MSKVKKFGDSKIELSQMNCYAGKIKAEVLAHTSDIYDEPGAYAQFIEGCGYDVYTMTPDEADVFADMLKAGAQASRNAFSNKKKK